MILIILRILFGAALAWTVHEAWRNGQTNLERGDILNAYYVALSVGLAILNAIVWAPFIGTQLAGPVVGTITGSTYVDRKNHLLRFIAWLDNRGQCRLARWLCFIEGIRHPMQPAQFIIGLNNAPPGSWLERVYALEVFKFNNIQNCVQAFHALRRHGIDPRPHANNEVNIVLLSLEREKRPEPELLVVPKAASVPLPARNSRIRLFSGTKSDGGRSAAPPSQRKVEPEGGGTEASAGTEEVAAPRSAEPGVS
jgi:hypothetical protein